MTLTTTDISERLKRLDEVILLEVLGIDSEMLVERFMDLVEDKAEELEEELDEGE